MYQLVEFKKFEGRIHYWAIKKVHYNVFGEMVGISRNEAADIRAEHAEAVNNPRVYAEQHNWEDE